MFNAKFFVRLLVAALIVVILFAVIPPFLQVINYPASSAIVKIVRLVIIALGVFYVFKGE